MAAPRLAIVMSPAFLHPSLGFSSPLDPDGTPLSELSWSSSLAVVALSFSGLFTFIFLMLACLCCKKGDIGFKEFENAEGEDYVTEFSVQGSPATQNGPEVYILPLTEVSLPMAKQPGHSVQLLKSTDLGRHSLLYLKEIGHGWFGKVFLGEVNLGLSSTQVVVKELKVSASVQDQMQFLEEAQPYRALQHTNLLQCLAQCAEVTPYLLVMEFCPLGDLKGYLRSCQVGDSMAPDPLTLQRMACEVACGILHLHKNHYVHSDLALRNCLLTADLTVKVGDYGLAHCKYKTPHARQDDYFVTADQLWVPLRWIAPELIDEVHGNLLIVDQTKSSNVWSLGVTIWELFELGNQPYSRYSDRQVLTYAIKEQQLKLPKPQLKLLLSERWYEVMQFCWLQPEQRPTAEEVHLLLSYLCAKGATEAEEEFERRWNSMKPNSSSSTSHRGTEVSSFPLLEHFSAEGFHSDGDDVLTVMETSHGLNFEYKWEPSKAECFQMPTGALSPNSATQYQDLYYPASSMGRLSLGVSPSCYECKQQGCPSLHTPSMVPILGTHSPSLSSEYYIRIEGPSEGRTELDYAMCSYSPDCEYGSPAKGSHWQAKGGQDSGAYDSDNSPTVSLTMEPLLGPAPPSEGSWERPDYYSYQCHSKEPPYYQPSPGDGADHYLLEEEPLEAGSKEWQVPSFQKNIFEDPLGISPSVNCAYSPPGYEEPHPAPLAGRLLECVGQKVATRPQGSRLNCITLELGEESPCGSPQCGSRECASGLVPEDVSAVVQRQHWTSNSSAKNNSSNCPPPPCEPPANDSWCYRHMITFRGLMAEPLDSVPCDEAQLRDAVQERRSPLVKDLRLALQDQPLIENHSFCLDPGQRRTLSNKEDSSSSSSSSSPQGLGDWESHDSPAFDLLEDTALAGVSGSQCASSAALPTDSSAGAAAETCLDDASTASRQAERGEENHHAQMPHPKGMDPSGPVDMEHAEAGAACQLSESTTVLAEGAALPLSPGEWAVPYAHTEGNPCADCTQIPSEASEAAGQVPRDIAVESGKSITSDLDRTPDKTFSSTSFPDMDDCSDEDTAELTSGVFTDFSGDYVERVDVIASFKSLQKQVGTPDSLESLDIPSTASSCEVFSPISYIPSSQPKALDSGYDTENYESPEFVLKEPHESREPETFTHLGTSPIGLAVGEGDGVASEMHLSSSFSAELHGLSEKNPYRDSAYFSDYDTDAERYLKEDEDSDGSEAQDREAGCFQLDAQGLGSSPSQNSDGEEPPQPSDTPDSPQGAACTIGTGTSGVGFSMAGEVVSPGEGSVQAVRPEPELGGAARAEETAASHSPDSDSSRDTTWEKCPSIPSIPAESVPSKSFFLSPVVTSPEGPALLVLAKAGEEELLQEGLSGLLGEAVAPSFEPEGPEHPLKEAGVQVAPEGEEQEDPGRTLAEELSLAQGWQLSLDLSLQQANAQLRPPGPERREEPEDEEEDTEDSDESDEELRCYNIQEQSEESEDEPAAVPIVVAENHSARNLRSLLKMPNLLSQTFCEDLERKKKAVSFYDDVTIYLFDQESPTRELSDQRFPEVTAPSPQPVQSNSTSPTSPMDRLSTSDDSDGNASEESGGFEWDDDFPLMPVKSSLMSSLTVMPVMPVSAVPSLPSLVPVQKQVPPIQFSRFTVSPAPVSRFSITHVSDSNIESVGGSSEDGDRE
ncbi:serine/threonine-protein kinase LMTK1 isoform X2 [Gopherus flavomarginatus]|uniref:serine/threonine-protein kinase LMTK1 isoform X2 n=1 Tax=Gopherus flavomarginatus TaxID=286002 RepID=UPI0021CBABD2|nr:serine/threonine-protein kinase LMTK1 isoform X2 [Gopherus flavomarginatus]